VVIYKVIYYLYEQGLDNITRNLHPNKSLNELGYKKEREQTSINLLKNQNLKEKTRNHKNRLNEDEPQTHYTLSWQA